MKRVACAVTGLAALWIAGCANAPSEPPAAQSATAESEVQSDSAPALALPASATPSSDQLTALSGDKPPPLPSAPPSSSARLGTMSEERQKAIERELAQLEIGALSSLNGNGTATDHVLTDSDVPRQLLEDAARSPGTGDLSAGRGGAGLNMRGGGGGEIRPGGAGGGLAGIGERGVSNGPGSMIAGKAAKDVSTSDLEKALAAASCTTTRLDSPSQPPSPGATFEAKCSGKTFVVTFVPAGGTRPDAKAIAEMDRLGTTWKEGGMLLAIVPGSGADRAAAVELLNKLRTSDGAPNVPSVKGNASIGGASVSGGTVSNAGAVVAGMAAGFRRCYQRGLKEDATMKGSVRVTAKIGPSGEVQSATPSGGGGLSGVVTSCVAGVVSSRTFAAPDGGSATIVIPVSFFPAE